MTVYDSSVLIDYLDGVEAAVAYVERRLDHRAVAPALVLFEIYQGELLKSGPADLDAVDGALEWLTVAELTAERARTAADLQHELQAEGHALAARDALVAGTALHLGERLAVADPAFDVDGLTSLLEVDFL